MGRWFTVQGWTRLRLQSKRSRPGIADRCVRNEHYMCSTHVYLFSTARVQDGFSPMGISRVYIVFRSFLAFKGDLRRLVAADF